MIDLLEDTLLTLADAAASYKKRLHVSTLHRWRLRGIRGIKLETILIGGVRYTSTRSLQEFAEKTTAAADGKAIPNRTSNQREADLDRAEKVLEEFNL